MVYKFDLTVEFEARDIDDAVSQLSDIEDMAHVTFVAPHSDNPEDFPEDED